MQHELLKEFLNEKAEKYNNVKFIETDPISIPHLCSKKEDIEIIAFLTATISWGNRKSILNNAEKLLKLMDYEPHNFIIHFKENKFSDSMKKFNHRTFFGDDLQHFFLALKNIYKKHNGLESCFSTTFQNQSMAQRISNFREIFFELPHLHRTQKHVSNPIENSACKRINMFLRWMVRHDNNGVDFGIWKTIKPAELLCPLDVHSARVARNLGLLQRTQNDWKATIELTNALKMFDDNDPIKYDFALFGLGVFKDEGF